jgi:exodeoxyribonuclease-5
VCQRLALRVLLVGDTFQLAPVRPENANFSCLTSLKTFYRAELTEVVRQALDNPILRASMMIRQSESQAMNAVQMLNGTEDAHLVKDFLAMEAGNRAIIAWRNGTRHALNVSIRQAQGFEPNVLTPGEPLLVMANTYALDRFNGEVVDFGGWTTVPGEERGVRDAHKNISAMCTYGVAKVEGTDVLLSPEEVFGTNGGLAPRVMSKWGRGYAMTVFKYTGSMAPPHLSANLGYCLTCHKAQGSEFNDVMVVIEPGLRPFSYEGRRWLYVAITRARKNVRICFMDSL